MSGKLGLWLHQGRSDPTVTEQRLVAGGLRTGGVLQLVQLNFVCLFACFEQLEANIVCFK